MAQKKPSMKVLKESAETFGVELAGGSIKAVAESLHSHFVDTFGEDNLARCPACEWDGPEKDEDDNLLATCPYCGSRFHDVPADTEPTPKKTRVATKRGAEESAEKEEYIATPEQKAELVKHVEIINNLRQDMARNAYDIGNELAQINDKALWRGIGYDSFFAYCAGELDFSRASAYKYMLVSREFNRDEFLDLGVKKGELIASAPDRHKKKLLAAASKGSSFSDLRSKLNKLEGKSSAPSAKSEGKLTLLGRVKEGGDILVDWLNVRTNKPITKPDVKGRYAKLQLTDEIEVVLLPMDNNLGIIANFRKIGTETVETVEPVEPVESETASTVN